MATISNNCKETWLSLGQALMISDFVVCFGYQHDTVLVVPVEFDRNAQEHKTLPTLVEFFINFFTNQVVPAMLDVVEDEKDA